MSVTTVNSGKSASKQKMPDSYKDPFWTDRDSRTYIDGKLVGGHVPLQLAHYLQLLAVYHEMSIQKTLQTLITEWCEDKEPVGNILDTLADRAYMEWRRRLVSLELPTLDTAEDRRAYEKEIRERLRKRKVTNEEHVQGVIARLKQRMQLPE